MMRLALIVIRALANGIAAFLIYETHGVGLATVTFIALTYLGDIADK